MPVPDASLAASVGAIFRPAGNGPVGQFAAGLSRCCREVSHQDCHECLPMSPKASAASGRVSGLARKAYFLDFFAAFFFVDFLAVFFLAAAM
jgi:hypothetical protein